MIRVVLIFINSNSDLSMTVINKILPKSNLDERNTLASFFTTLPDKNHVA